MIDITINEQQVQIDCVAAIYDIIQDKFLTACNKCISPIKEAIREDLLNSSTFQQLTTGRLYNEIGNPDILKDLLKIVDVIIENIDVKAAKIRLSGLNIYGEFSIRAIRIDCSDILSLPEAVYTYFSKKEVAWKSMNWLSWVLLEGGDDIVLGYHFVPKDFPSSRTGFGLMLPNGSWGLSETYGGTIEDNWLTREAKKLEPIISDIMIRELSVLSD